MSSKKSYHESDSKNVRVFKAVVSNNGHTIGRDYKIDDLHSGDLGLHLRVDWGKVDDLTPEQRMAAQNVAKDMTRDFLTTLGIEEPVDDIRPGMVVKAGCNDEIFEGMITRLTESLVSMKVMKGGAEVAIQLPRNATIIEQVVVACPGDDQESITLHGEEGLAFYILIDHCSRSIIIGLKPAKRLINKLCNPDYIRELIGIISTYPGGSPTTKLLEARLAELEVEAVPAADTPGSQK